MRPGAVIIYWLLIKNLPFSNLHHPLHFWQFHHFFFTITQMDTPALCTKAALRCTPPNCHRASHVLSSLLSRYWARGLSLEQVFRSHAACLAGAPRTDLTDQFWVYWKGEGSVCCVQFIVWIWWPAQILGASCMGLLCCILDDDFNWRVLFSKASLWFCQLLL